MKLKVGDSVSFKLSGKHGVGKIVGIDFENRQYLVHSNVISGHYGHGKNIQDNLNNWWFLESSITKVSAYIAPTYEDLKPYFVEETDLVNSPTHYNLGQIETREYILDVLHHNKHLEPIDGYYLGNILKYLSVRLGNKDDKLQDMKKAKNYLDKWIKEYEE